MATRSIARRAKGKSEPSAAHTAQKMTLSMERRVYLADYAAREFDALARNLRKSMGEMAISCEGYTEQVMVNALLTRMESLADALMDVGEVENDSKQDARQIENAFFLCPETQQREEVLLRDPVAALPSGYANA